MVVQIIFFVTMYPILFLMYFFLRPAGAFKNGYCFAVGMKKEWMEQQEVVEIQKWYRQQTKRQLLVLALIPFVTWVLPGFSIPLTVWMLWLVAVCILPMIPVARANARLKRWKRAQGFSTSVLSQTYTEPLTVWMLWLVAVCILPMIPVARANARLKRWKRAQGFSTSVLSQTYTEMKNAGTVRSVKLLPFLFPMLLSGAVAAVSLIYFRRREILVYGGVVVAFAMLTVLCYGMALWMDRQKTQVIRRFCATAWHCGWIDRKRRSSAVTAMLTLITRVRKKVSGKIHGLGWRG